MSSLTFIDLETPNRNNDSLCSIGIITRWTDKPQTSEHFYVNPETFFDRFNMQLHGITPEKVREAPVFSEIWRGRLASIFRSNTIIVGHNVEFDLRVLASSYRRTFQKPFPKTRYICTLSLARRIEGDQIPNHKLITCCCKYGIPLENYHNALDDITATAALFDCYQDQITEKDLKLFVSK